MISVVKCPTCGKDVRWVPESRFRPFCSDRCKQLDLGAWATEKYRIEGGETPSPGDDDSPGEDNKN